MATPVFTGVTSQIEEREVNSEYGQIYVNGFYQQDIIGFAGTLAIGRSEIPVAGSDATVYRTTRKTRDGTLTYRKSDSRWEDLIISYASLSPSARRALRAQGKEAFPVVQLLIVLDDPDSWGAEIIQLNGVRFWSLPIGYSGADIITRDIPCTWQSEQLNLAIQRPNNKQATGTPANAAALGYSSGTDYGGFGDDTVF